MAFNRLGPVVAMRGTGRRAPVFTALACLAALATASPARAETIAFTGATIIDATGRPPIKDGVLIVDNGRIIAIGDRRSTRIPAGARVIRKDGKYILPGLMDANVHLWSWIATPLMLHFEGRYQEGILEAAQLKLKYGVTSVFDTFGPRAPLVEVRDRIRSGQDTGSRIFVGGNIIGFDGPFSEDFAASGWRKRLQPLEQKTIDRLNAIWTQGTGGSELSLMTGEEVGAAVSDYIARGKVDFIKYASSGQADTRRIVFSPAAQAAIVAAGHRAGLTVQAHSTTVESLRMAFDAGADILTHCNHTGSHLIPDSLLSRIAASRRGCSALIQTRTGLAAFNPASFLDFGVADRNNTQLIARKVSMMAATDGQPPTPSLSSEKGPDEHFTDWRHGMTWYLRAAVEHGMSPMEALMAATRNVAKTYKLKDLGTLETGKLADLLILNADPLADAGHYEDIDTVVLGGRIVDREALPMRSIFEEGMTVLREDEKREAELRAAQAPPAAPATPTTPPTPIKDAAWRQTQLDYLARIDASGKWSKSPAGLRYRRIGKARPNAPRPASGTDVLAYYKVSLPDGTVLDRSEEGKPTAMPLNKTVPGFRAGVEMMHEGETYELVIPQFLGYGMKGGGPVPAGATLIFTVELVHVQMPAS